MLDEVNLREFEGWGVYRAHVDTMCLIHSGDFSPRQFKFNGLETVDEVFKSSSDDGSNCIRSLLLAGTLFPAETRLRMSDELLSPLCNVVCNSICTRL